MISFYSLHPEIGIGSPLSLSLRATPTDVGSVRHIPVQRWWERGPGDQKHLLFSTFYSRTPCVLVARGYMNEQVTHGSSRSEQERIDRASSACSSHSISRARVSTNSPTIQTTPTVTTLTNAKLHWIASPTQPTSQLVSGCAGANIRRP